PISLIGSLYKVIAKVLANRLVTVLDDIVDDILRRWKSVLAAKDVGGLGVSSLFTLNRELMFKWVWRFFSSPSSSKSGTQPGNPPFASYTSFPDSPSLVLDDSCVNNRELSRHVMGKVKDISSIPNLCTLLTNEGFPKTNLTYLGGLWVMIELVNESTRNKLLLHSEVKSWFHVIQLATHDFVTDEQVVWVDIEGVPLNLWSRDTFLKIGKKWRESIDIEENLVSSFARKRLCIKTNRPDNILEKFKITHRVKVYLARAKELFAWTPIFLDCKVPEYISDDDDVLHSASNNSVGPQQGGGDLVVDSDVEGVSDTIFDDNLASPVNCVCQSSEKVGEQQSEDLFGLYDLLKKHPKGAVNESDPSLSHPPGFTLEASRQVDDPIGEGIDTGFVTESSPLVHSKVINNSEEVHVKEVSKGNSEFRHSHNYKGGSILEFLDDMVRVGQSMGYDMDGLGHKTKKKWVRELNLQHKVNFLALQETKMDRITHMDVKFIWGNSNYQFMSSDSVGNSGEILCIWEATVFKKAYVTVSDNFIAIYRTWISYNSKVLIVVVYAPQSLALKRALWEYISSLISRWDGEPIVMGDFNDVRSIEERLGSVFNHSSARAFNRFIEAPGLVDVKLEGYSFTWSHPSASKMSKLDRDGFDAMVEHAWNSFSHSDSNRLIRLKKASGLEDPEVVKDAFKDHFANRFKQPRQGAVWNCGVNKSLGPDVFTFEFFRRYWSFIGLDFCSAIDCFFESGNFPMGSNASFIALIPKVTDAKFVTDFRPISLIGCVYKVVTKILANRLATAITDLVSETQYAFGSNRQILDGPFILNELIAWWKRKKKQAMIFKVDFAKAYDSVRWDYLLDVLHAFGFGPNWCKWIRGTFSSSIASVLVNGNPSSKFPFFYGLKQGDHLTPFLFILIMESLHISFSRATSAGVFNGIRINDSTVISHLFYADDVSSWGNGPTLIWRILLKSLDVSSLHHSDRKISWVSWEKVLASKQNGGPGVSSFYALNRALLLKWVWRFISQDGSLWYRVIQALYGSSFDLHSVHFSSPWCSILRETYALIPKGFNFISHCKKRIRDERSTRFWYDPWVSVQPLHVMFPHIFALETYKDSMVGSKQGPISVDVSFRRRVRDGAERQQWNLPLVGVRLASLDVLRRLECLVFGYTVVV
nr:RNA-directed DNA polymerase, eukaryota [Tanacetum cinerariifolium]